MQTTIVPYERIPAGEWDAFVRGTPGGTFFHLTGWKDVLERAFGFRSCYLGARRDGAMVGALPLFELRSILGGTTLLSVPFAVEGGICAVDDEARRALDATALNLYRERKAKHLELRDGLEAAEFQVREGLFYGFKRELKPTDEENMAAIPRKQRRMVRVGQQSGLTSRAGFDDLDAFHDLYARSVHQLGTPVFPRRYFQLLCERFPEECALLTVRHGDTPVAAVLSFFFNDTVMPYYAGSRREYFRQAVNDFLYWELMRYARERGCTAFDFGRSKKGTGAYDFKCHWGFDPQPLRYRVYVPAGQAAVERSMSSEGMQFLRKAWTRLPLGLTKLLGPPLIRRFGALYT